MGWVETVLSIFRFLDSLTKESGLLLKSKEFLKKQKFGVFLFLLNKPLFTDAMWESVYYRTMLLYWFETNR